MPHIAAECIRRPGARESGPNRAAREDRKLRILFLSHYFHPEGNAPATRVTEMTRRWAAQGHDVTVITGVPNVPDGVVYPGYRNRWLQRETHAGVEVVRVWTYLAPNKGTARRILNYVSFMLTAALAGLFVRRPDVVIATSPQFFCGWAGVIVTALRRLPFVLEIRDLWPESIEAVGAMRNRRLLRFLEWLEQRMYAAASRIVTVGDGYRAKLIERGVDPERIDVIPNGVDLARVPRGRRRTPGARALRARRPLRVRLPRHDRHGLRARRRAARGARGCASRAATTSASCSWATARCAKSSRRARARERLDRGHLHRPPAEE